MLSALFKFIPGIMKLGDKLIVDKDKKVEYAFKTQELLFKQMDTLLGATTYKWVDALVKLSYAAGTIMEKLFRPIGSAVMMVAGIYFTMKGIELDPVVQGILFGAFPAWGASRHVNKQTKVKKKEMAFDDEEDW